VIVVAGALVAADPDLETVQLFFQVPAGLGLFIEDFLHLPGTTEQGRVGSDDFVFFVIHVSSPFLCEQVTCMAFSLNRQILQRNM